MNVSSRTPEGWPNFCEVCGKKVVITPSRSPLKDATCPNCGSWLLFNLRPNRAKFLWEDIDEFCSHRPSLPPGERTCLVYVCMECDKAVWLAQTRIPDGNDRCPVCNSELIPKIPKFDLSWDDLPGEDEVRDWGNAWTYKSSICSYFIHASSACLFAVVLPYPTYFAWPLLFASIALGCVSARRFADVFAFRSTNKEMLRVFSEDEIPRYVLSWSTKRIRVVLTSAIITMSAAAWTFPLVWKIFG